MSIFKKKTSTQPDEVESLSCSVQWHDFDKNAGYPNYGTVTMTPKGLLLVEGSYDDGGLPPDRWFIGWGYLKGCELEIEERRFWIHTPGFNIIIYPTDEAEMVIWLDDLNQHRTVGGENSRRKF